MKVLIVSSTPNAAGLTAACAEAARQGVVDGRSPARVVDLNDLDLGRCAVCGDGWGTCRDEHVCQVQDSFQELHETIGRAEGYVFVTPVYFGLASEPLKALFDRLRRCEATKGAGDSVFAGKPTVCVAAAGGSGAGTLSCLYDMERVLSDLGADLVDAIPVTQRTREYQLETIHDALTSLVTSGREAQATSARPEPEDASTRRPRRRRGPRAG